MSASTIHEYAFNQQTAESAGDLFPPQIAEDSWIAYHGTSAIYEHSIDSEGIQPRSSGASSELVESVKELYRTMCWWGEDTGGYGVFYAFVPHSQWHDRPVFLAESSYRALLYATSDFAGGERSRGASAERLQTFNGTSEIARFASVTRNGSRITQDRSPHFCCLGYRTKWRDSKNERRTALFRMRKAWSTP